MVQINNMEQTPRRPRTSALIGQAIGGAMQAAGSQYLQGKMGEMFENRKVERDQVMQERSASGIASLFPKNQQQQVFEAFRSLPMDMHKQGLTTALDFLAGQEPQPGVGRPQSAQTQPQQQPQQTQMQQQPQVPTPITETKNLAASQRAGIGAAPGRPGYPQDIGSEPFAPMQQQYQPVRGMPNAMQSQAQAPQRVLPSGGAAPQPMAQPDQAGMVPERLIEPQAKAPATLADLTEDQFRETLKGRPASVQKQMIKDRKSDQAAKRGERIASAAEKRAEIAERKDIREAEKEPKEFIKKIDDEFNNTLKKRPIYRIMEAKAPELQKGSTLRKFISEKYHIAPGLMFKPNEEVLEKLSQQLLRGISGDYKGRILQSEVENYTKSNPSLLNTPEGMQKLAKISMALDEVSEKKFNLKNEIVKDYRKRKEPLPEDLETQIMEKVADFQDESYRKVEDIMNVSGVENSNMEMVSVINPDGVMGKMPRKMADEAIKNAGYKLR